MPILKMLFINKNVFVHFILSLYVILCNIFYIFLNSSFYVEFSLKNDISIYIIINDCTMYVLSCSSFIYIHHIVYNFIMLIFIFILSANSMYYVAIFIVIKIFNFESIFKINRILFYNYIKL